MKKDILVPIMIVVLFLVGIFLLISLNNPNKGIKDARKIKVVTTLFPLYDFTKNVGGDYVDVTLLLPPGVESHSFEPKPSDILLINEADVFVYTGKYMEPWVEDILKSVDTSKVSVLDASTGVTLIKDEHEQEEDHEGDKESHEFDPHIWLDFDNAKIMVNNIKDTLIRKNQDLNNYIEEKTKKYIDVLNDLDQVYKKSLTSCESNKIIYGGHYAFGYLAKRYNLSYSSAVGLSPDAEPTAKDIALLIDQIKRESIEYVFYEELSSPKIAETISKETGAMMLLLNAGHNLSKDQFSKGLSFVSIMKSNLDNLIIGLNCK
jgi:zinc transport system substrate-binding protein